MLRLKMPGGPFASRLKFDTQEVSDFTVHTVPHFSGEFAFGITDPNLGLQGNGLLKLKTGTR
jgi:hypothetical protein